MNKEIREISDDGKTIQVTTWDERWYMKIETDDKGKVLSKKEYSSVTWIGSYCPKGIGFYKFLAQHGWDEAEAIKNEAGNKGYKVHKGIEELLLGNEITIESEIVNHDGVPEKVTLEEYDALMSFVEWFDEVKPKPIESEIAVFNDEHMYAGTVDFICEIDGKVTLIDFKTSANIYESHEAQLSAYNYALEHKIEQQGILQLNYKKNKKKKWKYTEVEYDLDLFLAAKKFWYKACSNIQIFQKDYPTSLSINVNQ